MRSCPDTDIDPTLKRKPLRRSHKSVLNAIHLLYIECIDLNESIFSLA